MSELEEINEDNEEVGIYSKKVPAHDSLIDEEEDEKKYSPEAELLHNIITYTFVKVFNIAATYLPSEITEKGIEAVNSIFSIDNVQEAIDGNFKPIIDKTKEFGTKLFGDVLKGTVELANNFIENGTKFLSGMVSMFAGKISEKVASFGAPEQTRSDIEKTASRFDQTVKALGFDGSREQTRSQSTPSKPERKLDNDLGKALSEMSSAFSKKQEKTV